MPPRNLLFNSFDELLAEIDRLRASGYRSEGNWDLAQTCQHLSRSLEFVMEGRTFRPRLILRLVGPLFKKQFFRSPRIPRGAPSPAGTAPDESPDEAREIEKLVTTVRKYEQFNGPFARNAIFGYLTPEEWKSLQLIHAAHHLALLVPN